MNSINKNIGRIGVALLAGVLTFSCSDDFTSPPIVTGSSIVDVVGADPDLDLFAAALKATGLESTYDNNNSGAFTVLAPTDAAFLTYLQGVYADAGLTEDGALAKLAGLTNISSSLNIPTLVTRLNYHLISSEIPASAFTGPKSFTTINNARISFSKSGADVLINANVGSSGGKIVAAGADASNGVIHKIDKVLNPIGTANTMATFGVAVNYGVSPTGVTVSSAASNYNVLGNAIKVTKLYEVLLPNASPLPDYTIFAPTDAAFVTYLGVADEAAAIALINGYDAEDDAAEIAALARVIKYHVVSGRVLSTDLATGNQATILTGESIAIDATNSTVNGANITGTNTLTNTGIVHTIDAVIEP